MREAQILACDGLNEEGGALDERAIQFRYGQLVWGWMEAGWDLAKKCMVHPSAKVMP